MPVTYEVRLSQPRWIAGSGVEVELRMHNGSAEAFETPDPLYRNSPEPHFALTGPDGDTQEFRPNTAAEGWDGTEPVTLVHLAPGEDWEGGFTLSSYVGLGGPGRYTLRSWIEHASGRIESPPAEFEILPAETLDLTAETSRGPANGVSMEAVELLAGGLAASSILFEDDASNAETMPLERVERGPADPNASAILAPYSNFAVGLSAIRWILTTGGGRLTVGHNLTKQRIQAFGGAELSRIFPPVATEAGLYIAAVRGPELVLAQFPPVEEGIEEGPVRTIERLESTPDAAALTVSPAGTGNRLLLVMAWDDNGGTRLRFRILSPDGELMASAEQTVPDVHPAGTAAAGWSTTGEMRASLLVRGDSANQVRTLEFALDPELMLDRAPQTGEPVRLGSAMRDAQMQYFEAMPGGLRRIAVVRDADSVWVIPQEGEARPPESPVPVAGPLTILPGETYWYAVWPGEAALNIGPL